MVPGRERRVRRGSLVKVKALWRGWPGGLVSFRVINIGWG